MTAESLFIYVIKPIRLGLLTDGPTPEESEALSRHFAYLQRLADLKQVILAGRTQDATELSFGIVILRAPTESAARAIMEGDPAVSEGVMSARLHPYAIAIGGPS